MEYALRKNKMGIDIVCTCIYNQNIKIARAIKKEEGSDVVSPVKKGQKLTDNPKNVRLDLRLTKSEAEDLQYCANKLNTSRTDVINRGVKKIKEEIDKK